MKPSSAAFEEQYADMFGYPCRAAPDEIAMIWPPPRRRRAGNATLVALNTPSRLTSITWRHSAGDCSATGPYRPMPALLTSTSSPPSSSSVATTAASMSVGSVTSPTRPIALTPAASSSSTAAFRTAQSRATSATAAPAFPRRCAVASPAPRLPPVISTTLLASGAPSAVICHLRSAPLTRERESLEVRAQATVRLLQRLRQHLRVGSHRHEVRVSAPARHHVQVEVRRDAATRHLAQVHPHVEALRSVL